MKPTLKLIETDSRQLVSVFSSFEEASKELKRLERSDLQNKCYYKDFYQIMVISPSEEKKVR